MDTRKKKAVGRPTLAPERIDQILDAYTRCVARYGIEGTTLQLVADEAGMGRSHVRHYVGNREELRRLFGKRIIARYTQRVTAVNTDVAAGRRTEAIVRHFFRDELEPTDDYAAIDALLAASRYDTRLRDKMRAAYSALESVIASALAADYPQREPAVYEAAAYQILALAYGHWTLTELGFPAQRAVSARRMALSIIERVAATRV